MDESLSDMKRGVKEGSVQSPSLFLFVMNPYYRFGSIHTLKKLGCYLQVQLVLEHLIFCSLEPNSACTYFS